MLRERILEVLQNTHLMSLATNDEGGVWVADVIFLFDKDLNIYWMSDPEARHSKAILNNPKVAATITKSTESKEANLGIQLTGVAEKLEGIQFPLLVKHLAKRGYPKPKIKEAKKLLDGDMWYKLRPEMIGLIDEENFGFDRQDTRL